MGTAHSPPRHLQGWPRPCRGCCPGCPCWVRGRGSFEWGCPALLLPVFPPRVGYSESWPTTNTTHPHTQVFVSAPLPAPRPCCLHTHHAVCCQKERRAAPGLLVWVAAAPGLAPPPRPSLHRRVLRGGGPSTSRRRGRDRRAQPRQAACLGRRGLCHRVRTSGCWMVPVGRQTPKPMLFDRPIAPPNSSSSNTQTHTGSWKKPSSS